MPEASILVRQQYRKTALVRGRRCKNQLEYQTTIVVPQTLCYPVRTAAPQSLPYGGETKAVGRSAMLAVCSDELVIANDV